MIVNDVDVSRRVQDIACMATVVLTAEADEQAGRLPKAIRVRVLNKVERLEKWPDVSGAKALSGDLAGWFRLRTGDYRLRFRLAG
jgi:mRNA-degrading endonuclease RelE of RelBE toxin-antitoxin system